MSHRLFVGYFEHEHDALDAARECRDREISIADVISPYPIHGLDKILAIKPSRLPWVTLAGGAVGLALGLGFEYWSAAFNWPINVGGKPLDSLPAFIPVAFETTILFAGLATFFMLLGRSGLWPGKSVTRGLELTTDSHIAVILEQKDAAHEDGAYQELLERHGAVDVTQQMTEDRS